MVTKTKSENENPTRVRRLIHRRTEVDALMYDGTNEQEIKAFFKKVPHSSFLRRKKRNPIIVFSTLGAMEMEVGDYAITTETGDQYVVDKEDVPTYYGEDRPKPQPKPQGSLPFNMLKQRYINKCNRLDKTTLEYKIAKHFLDEIRELERTYK